MKRAEPSLVSRTDTPERTLAISLSSRVPQTMELHFESRWSSSASLIDFLFIAENAIDSRARFVDGTQRCLLERRGPSAGLEST